MPQNSIGQVIKFVFKTVRVPSLVIKSFDDGGGVCVCFGLIFGCEEDLNAPILIHGFGDVLLDAFAYPELAQEGLAREVLNRIQRLRKRAGLVPTDDVQVVYAVLAPASGVDGIDGMILREEVMVILLVMISRLSNEDFKKHAVVPVCHLQFLWEAFLCL